jgi:hypothetical protein
VSDMTSYSIALALGIRDTIATLRAELAAARERVEAAEKERAEWEATCRAHVENVRMARETLGIVEKERDKYRAEADALRAFKAYVHQRLDDAGVPTHPDGPHSKEGCRVGDRLDILIDSGRYWVGQYREAEARERALTEERDAYAEEMRAERSCKDAAQRANSELWRQVEALTEDNARLREVLELARRRMSGCARDLSTGIDMSGWARDLEAFARDPFADAALASRPPSDARENWCGRWLGGESNCMEKLPCPKHSDAKPDAPEAKWACDDCGKLRTRAEGGNVFSVCDECWDRRAEKRESPLWTCRQHGAYEAPTQGCPTCAAKKEDP